MGSEDEEEDDIDDNLEENDNDDSVSDFDDDDDPDKIEVPGGGRDLVTAMTFAAGPSGSTTPNAKPLVQPQKPVTTTFKGSYGLNGKPMISSLGLPILPVNTATTRVGGPTPARRGGYGGQPFTSEFGGYLVELSGHNCINFNSSLFQRPIPMDRRAVSLSSLRSMQRPPLRCRWPT